MKLVAHISDLHFGDHDKTLEAALLAELNGITAVRTNVVAISGDLTQRARRDQYEKARDFLRRLEVPYLVVPGNHDIPMFDLFRRFFRPRERYFEYITKDLNPFYADDEIAIAGIDTTKSFTIKDGEIRKDQLDNSIALFNLHQNRWKVLVAHHPFVVPHDAPVKDQDKVDGREWAVPALENAGVDLILSGHLHRPHMEDVAGRNDAHTMVAVHAGSVISTRLRGHPNGYNLLRFEGSHCMITHRVWDGQRFVDGDAKGYHKGRGAERLIKDGEVPVASFPMQPAGQPRR